MGDASTKHSRTTSVPKGAPTSWLGTWITGGTVNRKSEDIVAFPASARLRFCTRYSVHPIQRTVITITHNERWYKYVCWLRAELRYWRCTDKLPSRSSRSSSASALRRDIRLRDLLRIVNVKVKQNWQLLIHRSLTYPKIRVHNVRFFYFNVKLIFF